MKRHSTGALTPEAIEEQNQRYAQNHTYDYLIIGTGMAALSVAALLAHDGKRVCLLEAHDTPGGYAHSFKMGEYSFCAQVHYIWGCSAGEYIYEFLRYLGLEQEITFELLNPEGYDRMVMPDGKKVFIPYGFEKLAENIGQAYPGEKEKVLNFTNLLTQIREEVRWVPEGSISWREAVKRGLRSKNLIWRQKKTLQETFDEFQLSRESQAVLSAQAGDFMAPPKDLSLLAYTGLFSGYNRGAYYPTKHFDYFIKRIAQYISEQEGCHIYYETRVTEILSDNGAITSVKTADGKTFRATHYICNMDPQQASHLIGQEKFPKKFLPALNYQYSPSGLMIYLGLKGIDLREYGFGSFNTWHLEQWDMNKTWEEELQGNFENPWFFMSTPTLHHSSEGVAPEGGQILEVATVVSYEYFKKLKDQSYQAYSQAKTALTKKLLDLVEEKYIPELRKHIAVQVVGSPTTNEDFCLAPFGNSYGSYLTPSNVNWRRLKAKTPFKNFFWCNASSGYAGIHGTVSTGVQLYMDLTGNRFYDSTLAPSTEEVLGRITSKNSRGVLC